MSRNPVRGLCNYIDSTSGDHSDAPLLHEGMRLVSFHRITIAVSCIRLAAAGFYATRNGDETKCYSCGVTHRGWKSSDTPILIHKQISPRCRHVADIGTVTHADSQSPQTINNEETSEDGNRALLSATTQTINQSTSEATTSSTSQTTGLPAIYRAPTDSLSERSGKGRPMSPLQFGKVVHPRYNKVTERIKSFITWPKGHCKKPEDLARAGFFFAGYADCVRCYVCGVGLRTWEPEDDPWVEHIRWRSSCDYLAVVKGRNFVLQTLAAIGRENRNTNNQVESKTNHQRSSENESTNILDSLECRQALEMGFNSEHIQKAAQTIINSGGRCALKLEDLVEKILSASERREPALNTVLTETVADGEITQDRTSLPEASNVGINSQYIASSSTQDNTSVTQSDYNDRRMSRGRRENGHQSLPCIGNPRHVEQPTSASLPCFTARRDEDVEENRQLKESSVCKVCLDEPANIVFLPCGHLVTCVTCAPALERCPVCRKHIRGTVRIHLTNMAAVQKNM